MTTRVWGLLLLALPWASLTAACSEEEPLPETDQVLSERVPPASEGAGGAGGAGVEPGDETDGVAVCFPEIVVDEETGLPECFVAEVSEEPLDCTAPGREELKDVWFDAARNAECADRDLGGEECAALSFCGIVKLAEGSAREDCEAATPSAAGYCLTSQRSDQCSAAYDDSILVAGEAGAPVPADPTAALQVFCAVVSEGD